MGPQTNPSTSAWPLHSLVQAQAKKSLEIHTALLALGSSSILGQVSIYAHMKRVPTWFPAMLTSSVTLIKSQDWVASTTEMCFLAVLSTEAGSPQWRCGQVWPLLGPFSLALW